MQALNAGQTLTDTFTATTVDGTTQLITIIINGTNDAAVISGPTAGSVVEAGGVANSAPGTSTATGNLNSTDVDDPDQRFIVAGIPTASANGLGTYTMTVFGVWSYTLDNSNAAVQALSAGQTLTDTFTVTTVDGTSQLVTITINGANDAPVAVADSNAGDPVTEDGVVAGDPTAAGNVLTNDTDVDSGDSRTVTAVNGSALNVGQALVGAYGTLALGADGTWNYALDNTNPSTDALIQGQVATDAFSYTVADGHGGVSSSSLTITITGANDAPVANDDFANMVPLLRDSTGPFRELRDAPSLLSNDSDVDAGQTALLRVTQVDGVAVSQTPGIETTVIGVYGTLFVQADGNYRYVLDNLDPDTAALAPGELAQEHFDYIASNGAGAGNQAAATLTVEIEGSGNPDVPIVTNDPAPYYAFPFTLNHRIRSLQI